MAIILFSAADVSPPFPNWEYSAAFSTTGWAISDRNGASRSRDLGNTQQAAGEDTSGDMAWSYSESWEGGAAGGMVPISFNGFCFCKFSLESLRSARNTQFWPQCSLKKLQSH